ncbi:hypothetical protein MACJ_000723 [Theileria orientalis]|uniref:Uncharacterized protein n=1 Tax=Theileria orientalis TaxID=68886 RepID=A0A976M4I2_THEOR|nr:hypothetical protein MACJ_000723 [Theileria orientalis]
MTVGVSKRIKPTPPDRGSFPLDHEGLCKHSSEKYLDCIKSFNGNSTNCRSLASAYLKCRIENGLLHDEPLTNLGFRDTEIEHDSSHKVVDADSELKPRSDRKENKGFIAGELSRRVLTAVDTEFIYLLLRSSTIFKLIGLELTNLLLSNKENATHFRKVIVYVNNILEENWLRKDFVYDESTKIIAEKIGEPEIVWIRLIYQCLECLDRLSDHLGPNYIFTYKTYVNELNEPLEFLVHDMFDVALLDPGDKRETYTVNVKAVGFEEEECGLCGKLKDKEFKEEASLLQELYKDLDSLSKAHLDDLEMDDLEGSYLDSVDNSEESVLLPEILNKLANAFLDELRDKKKESRLNLFCIQLLIKLLPHSTKIEFVDKCLKSNNFDVFRVLMGTVQSFNTTSRFRTGIEENQLEEINWMMFKYCLGLMESKLTRENMSLVLSYMNKTLDSLCIDELPYSDLLKVAKRCEIEIHVGLDEVFRAENPLVSPHAFETMEKVMTIVSEAEEPFDTMDQFFSIFHRSIQLLFDYFDNLYEVSNTTTNENAEKYKESCLKLLSCWMTLEPMYYQNQFMDKLEKILSLLDEFDLVWLLPTFNFVELSDMDSVNRFLELLYKLIFGITSIDMAGDTGERALKMSCNLVTRLHLDQMIDYEKMLMTVDTKKFNINDIRVTSSYRKEYVISSEADTSLDLNEYMKVLSENLDNLTMFKPSYPVEFRAPICINLSRKSLKSYELLSSVSVGLLIKMIQSTRVEFVRNRLEVAYDLKAFDKYLTSDVEFDKIENLCYATEAAASTCLSRVYEGSSSKRLENRIMVVIMELVVHFFIHMAPTTRSEYLDDVHRISHYFTLCKLCILLMQNYSTFLMLFNYSVKKVCLKIATPPKEDFENMIDEGFAVEEDLVLCEFFSTYTSSIC